MTSLIRNKRGWLPALAGLALMAGLCAPAAAYDKSLSLTLASGQSSVRKAGVILGLTRPDALWQGERWRLMLRHEFELAAWRVRHARNLVEAGYSPVLRLERPLASGSGAFFVEGSIGVRALSHTRVSPERSLGSALHFSDMLGLGWQWGPGGRSTLGVRIQHLSNGGLKKPNPGIDFGQVYYSLRF